MTGPAAGGRGPGRVVAAAPRGGGGEQFTSRGVAGGVEPGDAGGTVVTGDPHTARPPHGALGEQGDLEPVGERIDAEAVEDQEEVGLALAHGALDVRRGP